MTRTAGWAGFATWAVVGSLLTFSIMSAASIGLFVMPFALLAMGAAAWLVRAWPEILGMLEGVAAFFLFVAVANRNSNPCPTEGTHVIHGTDATTSFSCGGWDPLPWLLLALVMGGTAVAVFVLLRWRST